MPAKPWRKRLPLYLVCYHLAISAVWFPLGIWRPPRVFHAIYPIAEAPVFLLFRLFAHPFEVWVGRTPYFGSNSFRFFLLVVPALIVSSLIWAILGWAAGYLFDQTKA